MSPIELVRAKDEEIKFNRFESAFAVDDAGRVLMDKAGSQYRVDFWPGEMLTLQGGIGVIFTHNHPRGWEYPPEDARHAGSSFSDADIAFACETEMAEMRVVTPASRLFMRPPETGWTLKYWKDVLRPLCAKHSITVRHDFTKAVSQRRMTQETASVRHWHEVWVRVAHDSGLVYGQEQE